MVEYPGQCNPPDGVAMFDCTSVQPQYIERLRSRNPIDTITHILRLSKASSLYAWVYRSNMSHGYMNLYELVVPPSILRPVRLLVIPKHTPPLDNTLNPIEWDPGNVGPALDPGTLRCHVDQLSRGWTAGQESPVPRQPEYIHSSIVVL